MSFFEVVEPEFASFVLGNAPVKQLANGFDGAESPVWFGDTNCLLFSDIPNNRIMRGTPGAGVSVFHQPWLPGSLCRDLGQVARLQTSEGKRALLCPLLFRYEDPQAVRQRNGRGA